MLPRPSTQPSHITLPSPTFDQSNSTHPDYASYYSHSPPQTPDEIPSTPTAHPLLAPRDSCSTSVSSLIASPPAITSFMQRQTSVAHQTTSSRSRPRPMQNVFQVSNDSRSSSSSSSSSSVTSPDGSLGSSLDSHNSLMSQCEFARCSRCQRTESLDIKTGRNRMIQYGLNLYYCTRCAGMVGLSSDR